MDFAWDALAYSPRVLFGLAIAAAGYFAAMLTRTSAARAIRRLPWAPALESMITTMLFYVIFATGVIAGVGTMGVNISPITAGLGLGGFAVGFALRDAASNFLAGALILVYRPFNTGDTLTVSVSPAG